MGGLIMRKQYKILDKSCGEYIEFKKIQPSIEEVKQNPRARSTLLYAIQRVLLICLKNY